MRRNTHPLIFSNIASNNKHKQKKKRKKNLPLFSVGLPGLEPGKTGPESVVLPLHHSPIFQQNHPFCFDDAKILLFYYTPNFFRIFFNKKVTHPLFTLKKSKNQIDFTSFFSFVPQNQVSLYFVFYPRQYYFKLTIKQE